MEIPSYFKRYLAAIQPPKSSRTRAMQLHTTLRDRLAGDTHYQDVYRSTFLYGSYRRNTAVKSIKDVDVCVVLDKSVLKLSPQTVVERLRRVLERNGYQAKTAFQRRSVRIDMSVTTLDAVPVVDATLSEGYYLIPDRKEEQWVPTYPKDHLTAIQERNRECNGRFVPLAKIVKAWFRFQTAGIERPKPKGFTLEALVFELQDTDAPSYAEAFVHFLEQLDSRYGMSLAAGNFPRVKDPSRPGVEVRVRVSPEEAKRFGKIVRTSLVQSKLALQSTDVADSAVKWNAVFGPDFPTKPAVVERSINETAGDEETDGALDQEISEADFPEGEDSSKTAMQLVKTVQAPIAKLNITARLARSETDKPYEHYPNNGRALPKKWWVVFSIPKEALSPSSTVRWTVENHGEEARIANSLFFKVENVSPSYRRSTAYRGSHTMTVEVIRSGQVVARGKHVVNVR